MLLVFMMYASCSILDRPLTKALTTSANVRVERIDETRALVKYDYGALIEANGKDKAEEAMSRHCSPQGYRTLESEERVSGEKRWTKIIVFECVNSK
jgi:hypothetical protein